MPMFLKKCILFILINTLVPVWLCNNSFSAPQNNELFLQIVKLPEETVLEEFNVNRGDRFFIDYIHSSDHTPIHDIFLIDEQGAIVLIEEDYDWYGAGLEFHPRANATLSFDGTTTRVFLHRVFPHFLLRVGRVANHIVTCRDRKIALKDLAAGGSLVWIRVVER